MNIKIMFERIKINYLWKTQKRISLKDERISNEEHLVIKLVKKAAINSGSEILTAPISNKRYIIDKENSIYIIMDGNSFSIISKTSKLRYYLNPSIGEFLWNFVDKEIEKKRSVLEKEINEIVTVNLDDILNKYGE